MPRVGRLSNGGTMSELRKGLIVSCQAEEGSPFNSSRFIAAFAEAAEIGGAVGVRVRDPENVRAVAEVIDLPIVGLTKGKFESGGVLITPTIDDVLRLVDSGADIIAVDATDRRRLNGMSGNEFLRLVKSTNILSGRCRHFQCSRRTGRSRRGGGFYRHNLVGVCGDSGPV